MTSANRLSRAEAERAIYIDFECLATTPPQPMLLGVFLGDGEEQFRQVITDDRLAPVRKASKDNLSAAALADTVGALAAQALAEERRIVGWSLFDRDRLLDARPDLAADIRAQYRNALKTARPWARTVYSKFPIQRADEFAPKHTLDQYAALSGYPHATRLQGATPAKWIRHVLQQLRASNGRYGRTTPETKRDWHALLRYNEHDCRALRHIVVRAARELQCWRAYERTRFCVDSDGGAICFTAGSRSPKLDRLLERHRSDRWAFITAWNPDSRQLTREENDRRQDELRRALARDGYEVLPGRGVGEDPSWEPEESVLVLGIPRKAAVRIGRQFGQLAIVAGHRGFPARLVPCARYPIVTSSVTSVR